MNTLDHLLPKIKRNLAQFDKPGVMFVRPGFKLKNNWPSDQEAIVAVTDPNAAPVNLPADVEGTPVDVRKATDLQSFSHNNPQQFAALADHRAELRGAMLQAFDPHQPGLKSPITPQVAAARNAKPEITYTAPPNTPLDPIQGNIPITCHVSPDAGWPTCKQFLAGTQNRLKVSMYDFTSAHVLDWFNQQLQGKSVQMTLDDPPRNPAADQSDEQTVQSLQASINGFTEAWALVRSSPEADTWIFPTAYHIKVMVRDGDTVWLSSGNLNNHNQPDFDPINAPSAQDQSIAASSDRDWHVVVQSPELAQIFEAYLDNDFQTATLHKAAGNLPTQAVPNAAPAAAPAVGKQTAVGQFTFNPPLQLNEQVRLTPLLTPDQGIYQPRMLQLIQSVQTSLYIQLQYIHPSPNAASDFVTLIDAVAAKINAGLDVRIILSEFQVLKDGLESLKAAGINLDNVRIQVGVHNKGFVFDHKIVVVSSMNWSSEGVTENRDAGLIIENENAAKYYEKIFLDDWENHAQQQMAPPAP